MILALRVCRAEACDVAEACWRCTIRGNSCWQTANPVFRWIQRILNGAETSAADERSTDPTGVTPSDLFSATMSVQGPEAKPPRFRSQRLSALWDRVRELSHPEHPFLDPLYSPGSLMPTADLSPWIAETLAADDWDAVLELLEFIATEHQITALRRAFRTFDFGRFVDADRDLLLELQAVAILVYRIQWTGHEDGRASLLAELFQHCLACHPFAFHPAAIDHLVVGANKLIRRWNREFRELRDPEPLVTAESLSSSGLPDISAVGESLKAHPVTFRACISYSLKRGSPVPGLIQPQLQGDYTLRQFGLSGQENERAFAECGIFEAPANLVPVGLRLNKEELSQIANAHGVKAAMSWKKDRLIAAVLDNEGARVSVSAKAARTLMQVTHEVEPAFGAWQARVAALRHAALALASA